jgi:hypothetical protein
MAKKLKPLELSSNALARALGVTPARINEIVRGRRGPFALSVMQPRRNASSGSTLALPASPFAAKHLCNILTINDLSVFGGAAVRSQTLL